MGIFRSLTKVLKKAAPIIGGAIGFSFGTPFLGTALGTGIGTLIAGGDTEDALKAGLMGGIAGYAGSKFFGPAAGASSGATVAPTTGPMGNPVTGAVGTTGPISPTIATTSSSGIMNTIKDFATSPVGIATLGSGALALGTLGGEEEKEVGFKSRPYPEGRTRLGTGLIDGKTFNLDDEEERADYFRTLRERQSAETLADGGEVEGPGTGTSDSVPAMLSDGEFVLTAKAVRGAGGGDRDVGAARMYDMMSELERVA
tara:strand:+ start:214 stop:984 length:771 start_codon:yes stop_codon:yes gene_type:complete